MTNSTKFPIQLGDPVEHRGVVIAPLFPRTDPRAEYLTLEEAVPLGFHVTEIDAAGSVPELLAKNPLDSNVLLYDGEELLGAKQNRILNVTVLVPARSETKIPVSCVEEGRWSARSAALRAQRAHRLPRAAPAQGADQLSAAPLERGARAERRSGRRSRRRPHRMGVDSPTARAGGHLPRSEPTLGDAAHARSRSCPASRARCSRSATASASTTSRGRTRSRASTRSCSTATCSTRSEHARGKRGRRLGRVPRRRRRGAAQPSRVGRARRGRAARGGQARRLGLELDGELIQLCAFSSEPRAAETRIVQPSSRF